MFTFCDVPGSSSDLAIQEEPLKTDSSAHFPAPLESTGLSHLEPELEEASKSSSNKYMLSRKSVYHQWVLFETWAHLLMETLPPE